MFLLAFVANPKRVPYSINCELYLVRILLTYFRLLNYTRRLYFFTKVKIIFVNIRGVDLIICSLYHSVLILITHLFQQVTFNFLSIKVILRLSDL